MNVWHVTLAALGRKVLYADLAGLRRCVRTIVRVVGDALMLFCVVDDHLHDVHGRFGADATWSGHRSRALRSAVACQQGIALEPSRSKAVADRSHLTWLIRYLFRQPSQHGLRIPNLLWEGSYFQDLVGARWIDGLQLRIWEALPRLRVAGVLEQLEVPPAAIDPVSPAELEQLGVARIVAAASAATATDPELTGRAPSVVQARAAVVRICRAVDLPDRSVAHHLGVARRTLRRLARYPVPPQVFHVVRVRLALEQFASGQQRPGRGREPDVCPQHPRRRAP